MSANKKKTRSYKNERGQKGALPGVMLGGIYGFIVVVICLGLLSLLVNSSVCRWQAAELAVCLLPLLGGVAAGILSGELNGKRNVPCGVAAAAAVFVLLLSCVLILPHASASVGQGSVVAALCLCGGVLGALLRKKNRKR